MSEGGAVQFGFSARELTMLLWAGLAVLTVSLFVLSRTRWGQSRPVSKCVVLSLLAHVLLAGYAYGTRLILTLPAPADQPYFRLTIAEAGDVSPQAPQEPKDEPHPWDRFATETGLSPDVMMPDRLGMADAADPQPRRTDVEAAPASVPSPDRVPLPEPTRPTPDDESLELPRTVPSPQQLVAIETPKPPRRSAAQQPAVPLNELSPPSLSPDPAPSIRRGRVPLPEPAVADADRLQRLAELPNADQADAQAAQMDETQSTGTGLASDSPQIAKLDVKADESIDRAPPPASVGSGVQPRQVSIARSASSDALPEGAAGQPSVLPRRGDGRQMPSVYQYRVVDDRLQIAARHGGSARTEAAVRLALTWLANHQSPDGRWSAAQHEAGQERKVLGHDRQAAGARADTGLTGLALLAFLGSGHTHQSGPYQKQIQRGLAFLQRSQSADGNLGGDAGLFAMMYCHGMATWALAEAYAMTADPSLKPTVERAIRFTLNSQHPTNGGWRYRPGDEGDTSQFGWQVMALKSAELGGIQIPWQARNGMLRFLRRVSSGQHGGLASYRPGEPASRAMTAEALAARLLAGLETSPEAIEEACRYIAGQLPGDGPDNLYYWYYATLALYQADSPHWPAWNEALKQRLIDTQRTDGDAAGSWDPQTVWGGYGGRVYTTAMGALCLEVYYRYLPVLAK